MGTDCPYRTLRVRTDADGEQIKAAYRRRALESHPDTGGDVEEFRRVQAAYETLKAQGALERRRPRFDPYRQTLDSLDAASRLQVPVMDDVVRPLVRRRPSDRFDDLFQMELRRQRVAV